MCKPDLKILQFVWLEISDCASGDLIEKPQTANRGGLLVLNLVHSSFFVQREHNASLN